MLSPPVVEYPPFPANWSGPCGDADWELLTFEDSPHPSWDIHKSPRTTGDWSPARAAGVDGSRRVWRRYFCIDKQPIVHVIIIDEFRSFKMSSKRSGKWIAEMNICVFGSLLVNDFLLHHWSGRLPASTLLFASVLRLHLIENAQIRDSLSAKKFQEKWSQVLTVCSHLIDTEKWSYSSSSSKMLSLSSNLSLVELIWFIHSPKNSYEKPTENLQLLQTCKARQILIMISCIILTLWTSKLLQCILKPPVQLWRPAPPLLPGGLLLRWQHCP